MKNTYKLCGAALLATVAIGLVVPSAVKADDGDAKKMISNGKIEFTEDTGTTPITPPGTEGPEITEPTENEDKGPLSIVTVTDLDFGKNRITTPTGSGWEYFAALKDAPIKDDENGATVTIPHFVRFKDNRADELPNTHIVKAALTKQFTNDSGKTLNAATITYNNIRLLNTNAAHLNADALNGTTQTLAFGAEEAKVFVDQQETGKGFGVFDIAFGEVTDDAATSTAAESVKLSIPGDNVLSTSSAYTAEITWTIETVR